MKKVKILFFLLLCTSILSSCSKDDSTETGSTTIDNPAQGLTSLKTFSLGNYTIVLYSSADSLQTGYNDLYFTVKDATGNYVSNANIQVVPQINSQNASSGCPYSEVSKVENKNLYHGYVIFSQSGIWNLALNYTIGSTSGTLRENVNVKESASKRLVRFTGNDSAQYIAALIEPSLPVVGLNNITALLYKLSNTSYTLVSNDTIKLDPRMPDMGNHTSPHNVDLYWKNNLYSGTVNFSMSGYWVLNLIVKDSQGTLIKGEEITNENKISSIYFDIEF